MSVRENKVSTALLDIPLPLLTPRRLDVLLRPRPGERILEIGPGTGLQSLPVAPRLGPEGGRLVIGEFADRHHVTLPTLVRVANEAGLHFRRRTGVPLAYYALFAPCGTPTGR